MAGIHVVSKWNGVLGGKGQIDPTGKAWLQVPHRLSSLGVGDVEMGSL